MNSLLWNTIADKAGGKDMTKFTVKVEKENSNTNFLDMIKPLMLALSLEKNEDEKNQVFQERLFAEVNKIIKIL